MFHIVIGYRIDTHNHSVVKFEDTIAAVAIVLEEIYLRGFDYEDFTIKPEQILAVTIQKVG